MVHYVKNHKGYQSSSLIHNLYVTRFNAVDLADRYYAKVVDGHRVLNWHTKLFYAIVKLGMINVYVTSMIEEWNDW